MRTLFLSTAPEASGLLSNLPSSTAEALTVAGDVLPPLLMVVGVVMLGVILTMSIRGKIAKRRDDRTPRERIDAIRQRVAERREGEELIATESRLLDTAQRLTAQIDAKAERLEQLVVQADRRIAQLRELNGPEGARAGGDPDLARSLAHEVASVRPADRRPAPVEERTHHDPLTTAVYELADAGHDSVRIAQALDEQVGKVDLILALRSA